MKSELTIFTCSIYPDVTRIWFHCLKKVLRQDRAVVIYDSSGLLEPKYFPGAKIILHPNVEHGKKIDHFVSNHLETKYFLLLDDDAFLTSSHVIDVGLEWIADSADNVIFSFKPRPWWSIKVNGVDHLAMGSYALLVKAFPLIDNKLSFSSQKTNRKEIRNGSGYYDTADFINEYLLKQGYAIRIAPPELMDLVPTFFGTSSGFLGLYRNSFFSKRMKKRGADEIKRFVMNNTYNLQRAASLIFVNHIYRQVFGEDALYKDFMSLEHLEKIVIESGKQDFILFFIETIRKYRVIEEQILTIK